MGSKILVLGTLMMGSAVLMNAQEVTDSIALRIHFEGGELTPACLPYAINRSQVDGELYAVGGIENRVAKIYPVSRVEAGMPFVVRSVHDIDTLMFAPSAEAVNFKEVAIAWNGGSVKGNDNDYSWTYTNMDGRSFSSSRLAYQVMDFQQMNFRVNLENLRVRRYLHDVNYTFDSESEVANYILTSQARLDYPNGVLIPIPETTDGSEVCLTYGVEADLSDALKVFVPTGETSYFVYNLLPQHTYYYQVAANDSVISKGRFDTEGHVRMIHVPSVRNVRDMGGWKTDDGKRVKYGMLFRGGELNGKHIVEQADIDELLRLGIGAEIDMRALADDGAGTSALGFVGEDDVEEGVQPTYYCSNNSTSTVSQMSSTYYQQRLKKQFEFIVSNLRDGRAVYHHCAWGADRTGVLSLLLEGMLNVSFDNLIKDYELTAFAEGIILKSKIEPILNYLNNLEGDTFSDKICYYWTNRVNVSVEDIEYFRSVMLEEVEEQVDTPPYSGTLPVVFIQSDGPIVTKTDYVNGSFYIDALDMEDFTPVGSVEQPLPLQIRGRGNWTWFGPFEKKPYKVKLGSGLPLLNMGSNKHWALLSHADGGDKAYFRNAAGFELGRIVGFDFTPRQQPVELVLNGEYEGLYFLTETVRVGKRRVNITEQADNETDPELITGGWLVEIDNSDDNPESLYFPLEGTELTRFCITSKSPETLSEEQYNYLFNEFTDILSTVYTADKNAVDWEDHIDMTSLAKYYLVNEMIDQVEAFLGSCYLHKDLGETKWKFGPLWDLGHAFNDWHEKDKFIYEYKHETEEDWEPCIMEELAKFPRLQTAIKNLWNEFYPAIYNQLEDYLYEYTDQIAAAAVKDHERWPAYGTADAYKSLERCLQRLNEKRSFLVSQWGDNSITDEMVTLCTESDKRQGAVYNLQGQRLSTPPAHGLYIWNDRKIYKR